MGFYLNKTSLFKMYQTFYIVLFLAVYSSASPAVVTKDVLMNQFELEPISTDAAIEEPPENPANSSYVDLSKKHVIEKGESCDPFLDGCEAGTICWPTTFDLSENVCAEFDAEKFFEETKSIKKNKNKTKSPPKKNPKKKKKKKKKK